MCGKPLGCGRHSCQEVCHAGKCSPCALAGPKACPCGKQVLPHAACDVVVPPCGETCGKLLSCGAHHCHERCEVLGGHWGESCGGCLRARRARQKSASVGACPGERLACPARLRPARLWPARTAFPTCRCHTGACTTVCRETVEKSCECGKAQRTVQVGGAAAHCGWASVKSHPDTLWSACTREASACDAGRTTLQCSLAQGLAGIVLVELAPACPAWPTAVPRDLSLRAALLRDARLRAAPVPPPLLQRAASALRGGVQQVA